MGRGRPGTPRPTFLAVVLVRETMARSLLDQKVTVENTDPRHRAAVEVVLPPVAS